LDSVADFIADLVIKEVPVKESDSVFTKACLQSLHLC